MHSLVHSLSTKTNSYNFSYFIRRKLRHEVVYNTESHTVKNWLKSKWNLKFKYHPSFFFSFFFALLLLKPLWLTKFFTIRFQTYNELGLSHTSINLFPPCSQSKSPLFAPPPQSANIIDPFKVRVWIHSFHCCWPWLVYLVRFFFKC